MKKMVTQMALIGLLCFAANAATIKVAKGASISTAVKNAVAKDSIMVAAGTFKGNILVDKQLTIIGVDKDSTIIMRDSTDSVDAPSIKVTAKHVVLKNLTIFGHEGYRWGDTLALTKSYPPTDAVLLSAADSTSIQSCNMWAGNGVDWRSIRSASGAIGLNVFKSKGVTLADDSIRGGFNDRTGNIGIDTIEGDSGLVFNPLYETGVPGYGILIDSSSYLKANKIFVMGGDGRGMNYKGYGQAAANGIFCVTAESISVENSTLFGGQAFLMVWDTSMHAVYATVNSSVKLSECTFSWRPKKVDETSTVEIIQTAILSYRNQASAKNTFGIRYSGQSLVLSCALNKASSVSIDVLNAQGRAIKRIRTARAEPGLNQFAVDLKSNGSMLANAAYFLRISTNENSRSFRLQSVR